MKYKILVVLVAIIIIPLSCHKVTRVNLIDQISMAPSYEDTLKKWTKSTKYYFFHDVEFFVSSTYKSWPLRLAYMKEYSKKFKLSVEEQKELYDKELSNHKSFNDFFLTIFSSRADVNDLANDDNWRIFLHLGDITSARLKPESIKKIKNDSKLKYFYPHVSPWTTNFDIRFSKVMSDASNTNTVADQFSTLSLMIATLRGEETFTFGVDKQNMDESE